MQCSLDYTSRVLFDCALTERAGYEQQCLFECAGYECAEQFLFERAGYECSSIARSWSARATSNSSSSSARATSSRSSSSSSSSSSSLRAPMGDCERGPRRHHPLPAPCA
eukprot:1002279-Alexandrium_andersonii.AAC.1